MKQKRVQCCPDSSSYDLWSQEFKEETRPPPKAYDLPDGGYVRLSYQWIDVGEALFKPSLIGKEDIYSLPEQVKYAILPCDSCIRRDMWKNIVITGGTAKMGGFKDRMKKELQKLVDEAGLMETAAEAEPLEETALGTFTKNEKCRYKTSWDTTSVFPEDMDAGAMSNVCLETFELENVTFLDVPAGAVIEFVSKIAEFPLDGFLQGKFEGQEGVFADTTVVAIKPKFPLKVAGNFGMVHIDVSTQLAFIDQHKYFTKTMKRRWVPIDLYQQVGDACFNSWT